MNKLKKQRKNLNGFIDKLLELASKEVSLDTELVKVWEIHTETVKLIDSIVNIENELLSETKKSKSPSKNFDEFLKFLTSNKVDFSNVSIEYFKDYDYGLKANKTITIDELLVKIPKQLFFTAKSSKMLRKLAEKDILIKNMENVQISLALLGEKYEEKSFWKPYIDILPSEYPNLIFYFNINQFELLKNSPVLRPAIKLYQNVCRQYAYLYKLFQNNQDQFSTLMKDTFSFNEYRWAVSTIMTRQNLVPENDNDDKKSIALIPLWDMLNHSKGHITTYFNPSSNCLECMALDNYEKNDQVFIFYGPRSNPDFFLSNGFVYIDNEHDGYILRLNFQKNEELNNREELFKHISNNYEFRLINSQTNPIPNDLIAFLRILSMNKEKLELYLNTKSNYEDLKNFNNFEDKELDEMAWKYLKLRIEILLKSYQKIDEDDKNSIIFKLKFCEKRILQYSLNFINKKLIK